MSANVISFNLFFYACLNILLAIHFSTGLHYRIAVLCHVRVFGYQIYLCSLHVLFFCCSTARKFSNEIHQHSIHFITTVEHCLSELQFIQIRRLTKCRICAAMPHFSSGHMALSDQGLFQDFAQGGGGQMLSTKIIGGGQVLGTNCRYMEQET